METPVEHVGPLVEDARATGGVVGDRGREPQSSDQVESRLHQLAAPGSRLVGAEELNRPPVRVTADPLLDDTLFMFERWRAAGNQAELAVYSEGAHGFNLYPIALGRKANARQHEFLRAALA